MFSTTPREKEFLLAAPSQLAWLHFTIQDRAPLLRSILTKLYLWPATDEARHGCVGHGLGGVHFLDQRRAAAEAFRSRRTQDFPFQVGFELDNGAGQCAGTATPRGL